MGRLASSMPLLSLALAFVAACRGSTIPPSEIGPIRIGVVLPQSGGLAQDGMSWVRGVSLAADEVNAAGGLLGGRRVVLDIVNSGTDSNTGVAAARMVIAGGAVAIIGDGGSGSTLAIYQMVTQPAGIPQISGSATSTSLTSASASTPRSQRYFFRTAPPDGYQAQVVDRIATMTITPACRSLAILYQNDAYGMPLAQGIMTSFSRHGMVPAMVPFMPAQASYMTETMRVASAMPTPDCVALIAYPQDAGVILRNWNMTSGRPSVKWIGTDGLFSQDFITQAADPMFVTHFDFYGASPLTTPNTPEFDAFAARYRTAYGHPPENFVASYYDATALVLLAIERAGTTEGGAIRDALHAIGGPNGTLVEHAAALREALAALETSMAAPIHYTGASGPVAFDANGDTVAPYEIWHIQQMPPGSPPMFHTLAVVQASDLTMLP